MEALLVSLIVAIGLFLFEFYKMKSLFEGMLRYNSFSRIGPVKLFDSVNLGMESDLRLSEIEKRLQGTEGRISRQDAVIEKLIKEMIR